MKGRKPKPDHLKVVSGTDQPCRMNPDAPVPKAGRPVAPELLSDRATALFEQLLAIIDEMGIASASDVHVLMLAAMRLEEIEQCTAIIEDEGRTYLTESGQIKGHPAVAQRNEAMRHAQSLLAEFGLSPAARSKVSATKKTEENPFAAFG